MIPVKTALLQVVVAAALLGPGAGAAVAQERPAKRVADIVGVALAEYEKGIDSAGRLISQLEFEEAVSFLGTARDNAQRLSGTGADHGSPGPAAASARTATAAASPVTGTRRS